MFDLRLFAGMERRLLPYQVESEKLNMRLSGEGVQFQSLHTDLKHYYSYKGEGHESWMASMFLSPRGTEEGRTKEHIPEYLNVTVIVMLLPLSHNSIRHK